LGLRARRFARRREFRTRDGAIALRELGLPALACLGLLIVGVAVLRGDMIAIYGLVIVIAALLTTASWNAWLLLVPDDEPAG